MEGSQLGCDDGIAVGWEPREADGITVQVDGGSAMGSMDGYSLSSMEIGCDDGLAVGSMIEKADGTTAKVDDGSALGSMDGYSLGSMEGSQLG